MRINKEFWFVNFGMLLIALDIHLFKTPNHFALGGTSGISILVLHYFSNASVGILMFLLNFVFLFFGYFILGKKFTINTIYGSFVLSLMVWLLDLIFPLNHTLTNQKLMELIYSVFLPGIGNAIVFSYNSTTGGTDILGKIISKLFKIKISISMLIIDFIIAFSTGLVFGVETCLFSVLGVCLKSFVLDSFMENIHVFKILVIVTNHGDKIKKYICDKLKRGATIHKAYGAFTQKEHDVITTILSRSQAANLQNYIKSVDEHAFITITNSSRIIGNGFDRFD
jgi:Uncharacterized conserved protein